MLFQVGGQGARPTFFEMAAAQQLPVSLRAALVYSLGVFAQRQPFLHKILDFEDEFFALLMAVLELHSLRTTDASFSESLYGLRRRGAVQLSKRALIKDSSDGVHPSGLRKRQKILSVVFLVLIPYLKSKMQSMYNREREARLRSSIWSEDEFRTDEANLSLDQVGGSNTLSNSGSVDSSSIARLSKRIRAAVGVCYPWIHATTEGLRFAYQLLYLLDATVFYSPDLHAIGLQVSRATGQEMMDSSSKISRIRSRELERLHGPPWLKAVQRTFLSCIYTTLDYAQTGLIAAVFFFKMMEWWYQSAEVKMSAPVVYPPPPPPPSPKVAKDGIPLPPDRALCPLCLQKRDNPSVLTVSGFVFCYTCIFKSVSQHKRCPVTHLPATTDHIRHLFHDL